jgi:hypothetical protein
MWKSRVVCEISKGRWKSFCDFHGPDISAAGPQNQILEQGSTRSTRSRSTSGLLKNQMEVSGLEDSSCGSTHDGPGTRHGRRRDWPGVASVRDFDPFQLACDWARRTADRSCSFNRSVLGSARAGGTYTLFPHQQMLEDHGVQAAAELIVGEALHSQKKGGPELDAANTHRGAGN